ncbi:Sodium/hydrogen exchanger 9B2 [Blattella germanica]|nr:Sodium/hydrogen exchanger 9B2 [Blattella germanica]
MNGDKVASDVAPDHQDPLLTPQVKSEIVSTAPQLEFEDGAEKNETKRSALSPVSLCPEASLLLQVATFLVALIVVWGVGYSILQDAMWPGGPIFALVALFLLATFSGWLVSLAHLPPLLGMLLAGILLRFSGLFVMSGPYLTAVSTLRLVAMVVILIKAGLGLDAAAFKRLSFVVVRLAFLPCLVETATDAVVAHLVLGFPWLWGFLLGFVLAAVSPAVVVPSLLGLQEKGYGEDKGISTLVIAASSIDDIAAISGFGVVLGIIFSQGELFEQLIHGPIEVVMGLSFGISWGVLLIYLPHRNDNPVADIYSVVWKVFQPVLFGLIGTEIDLRQLDGSTILYGLCVLVVGLVMLFVAVAWFPKATVQAALGHVALDLARKTDADEGVVTLASQVLTIAVLSILITAPIGAIGIFLTGPKLLGRLAPDANNCV